MAPAPALAAAAEPAAGAPLAAAVQPSTRKRRELLLYQPTACLSLVARHSPHLAFRLHLLALGLPRGL